MTTKEAADTLGYTPQHTRLLIREGKLPAVKSGRDWLLPRKAVEDYLAARGDDGSRKPESST